MIDILHREFVYIWYYFDIQLRQIFPYWVLGMVLACRFYDEFCFAEPAADHLQRGAGDNGFGGEDSLLFPVWSTSQNLLG